MTSLPVYPAHSQVDLDGDGYAGDAGSVPPTFPRITQASWTDARLTLCPGTTKIVTGYAIA